MTWVEAVVPLSLSLSLTPPFSLFDGKDYKELSEIAADNTDPARQKAAQKTLYNWLEYHKWSGKAQWYFPLSTDNKLVLMARAEMGYLGSYNPYKISPFEGYDVGGDGMTGYTMYGEDIIAMRGYKDSELNPAATAAGEGTLFLLSAPICALLPICVTSTFLRRKTVTTAKVPPATGKTAKM